MISSNIYKIQYNKEQCWRQIRICSYSQKLNCRTTYKTINNEGRHGFYLQKGSTDTSRWRQVSKLIQTKEIFLFCNVIEGRNRRRNTIEIGMPHIYSMYILTISVIHFIINILAICIQLNCDTIDVGRKTLRRTISKGRRQI